MRIYVTGATGYVGKNLVPLLLRDNHEVVCLLRSPENYLDHEIYKECNIIKGDITDRDSLRSTIHDMDIVIHLAVVTPLTEHREGPDGFYRTNVLGTKNVLEECLASGTERILCFSSTAAIGRPKTDFIDENTPLHPVNDYGRSKKEADRIISSFIKKDHLPVLTICFPHIYGPGDKHEFLKVVKMIQKGILPQVGFSPNLLPSVFISDAIDVILLGLEKGKVGERYIIADEDPHDIRKTRRMVLENLGIDRRFYPFIPKYIGISGAYILEALFGILGSVPPIKAENIKSITAGRRLSIEKAKKDMGFRPKIPLEEGIRRTIECYKEKGLL